MSDFAFSDIEITADNFADLLPAEPEPLADEGSVQEPAEPTPDDLSDDEILALEAVDADSADTVTDDLADWDESGDDPDPADDATQSAS